MIYGFSFHNLRVRVLSMSTGRTQICSHRCKYYRFEVRAALSLDQTRRFYFFVFAIVSFEAFHVFAQINSSRGGAESKKRQTNDVPANRFVVVTFKLKQSKFGSLTSYDSAPSKVLMPPILSRRLRLTLRFLLPISSSTRSSESCDDDVCSFEVSERLNRSSSFFASPRDSDCESAWYTVDALDMFSRIFHTPHRAVFIN